MFCSGARLMETRAYECQPYGSYAGWFRDEWSWRTMVQPAAQLMNFTSATRLGRTHHQPSRREIVPISDQSLVCREEFKETTAEQERALQRLQGVSLRTRCGSQNFAETVDTDRQLRSSL